jgi:hypothetical protein
MACLSDARRDPVRRVRPYTGAAARRCRRTARSADDPLRQRRAFKAAEAFAPRCGACTPRAAHAAQARWTRRAQDAPRLAESSGRAPPRVPGAPGRLEGLGPCMARWPARQTEAGPPPQASGASPGTPGPAFKHCRTAKHDDKGSTSPCKLLHGVSAYGRHVPWLVPHLVHHIRLGVAVAPDPTRKLGPVKKP